MTRQRRRPRRRWMIALLCGLLLPSPAGAQDMPDPSLINGRALPAGELPDGTVTVRVVREAIGNNLPGQQVHINAGGRAYTATTDDLGRAEFKDLPRGAEAQADATVDGEPLSSQPFTVPSRGGLRVILVSGLAGAAERRRTEAAQDLAAPPVRGAVVLGGETRIIAQFQSDTLSVSYRLDIVNNARTRVETGGPLILDLPKGAGGAALSGEAPKSATLNGTRLTVVGPFNPGTTTLELNFLLPHYAPELTLRQKWPVPVQQWLFAAQKVGMLSLSSPQFQGTEERTTEEGSVFIVGTGAPMAAGSELTVQFAGLPLHGRVATRIAVGLALALLAAGAWMSIRATAGRNERSALVSRRDALLGKLADLETSRRAAAISNDRYLSRRERLVAELEQIYGELDEAGGPRGGGEDVAA